MVDQLNPDADPDRDAGTEPEADATNDPTIEMQEDGSAIITMHAEESQINEEEDFYGNIVDQFDESILSTLGTRLITAVERDKKARKKRDEQYEEAIKRTGLGKEAPGGAQFEGASRAVHPMLLEAALDFEARAIRELMPPNGPVKMFVPGKDPDPNRLEKAERKKEFMNWQLVYQMPEFRSELEQLLTQLPLGGAMYLRLVPDFSKRKRRPVPTFIPIDYVTIPSAASNYYTAERQCYWEPVTQEEFETRTKEGMYRDIEAIPVVAKIGEKSESAGQLPEETGPKKASDKVEGKEPAPDNSDGLRTICEISTHEFLEEERDLAPYLISIDQRTKKILSIVRNWEEQDDDQERMQWMVEWVFWYWRGAQGIGLGQAVGSLAGAATGALRALLDSAHIQNIPTMARLKGANFAGQSSTINATQVIEVKGGVAADQDIRKLLMNIPFNPPSEVLFQLLGFLTDTGRQTLHVALDKLSEDNSNLPVGTTLALIEEGMKVMSAIHLRLFHSMSYVIRILHRINRMYLTEDDLKNDVGEVLAYRADFEGPLDCIPTADPEIFSDVQRIAQAQIIADRAAAIPGVYNTRETELFLLERAKVPNPERFLVPEPKPEEMNQVNENVAMALGRPVVAFPEQNHLAHLKVMTDFMMSPFFGQNPIIAQTYLGPALQHMKEHIVLWYAQQFYEATRDAAGMDDDGMTQVMQHRDPDTRKELDLTLASASGTVMQKAQFALKQLPPVIQQAQALLQKYAPPSPQMPIDPNKQAETQRKAQADQQKAQIAGQKLQQDDQHKVIDLQAAREDRQIQQQQEFANLSAEERRVALQEAQENARSAQELAARLDEIDRQERAEDGRVSARLGSEERRNTQDNLSALRIAAAEIRSKEKAGVATGTGTNPNPSGSRKR
jgi:hypothetical protein